MPCSHSADMYGVLVTGVRGGVSKCSPPADFKPPATPRKHRCPEKNISIYIYKYVCVSRSCLAHTVLTCPIGRLWGGVGGGVSKLPATPRKQRSPHDEGLYMYKYVCVCVSRSCLAHTVLTCMEYWSRGFGEAFLSVHPQLISSLRQPQESTDAPRMKVYIYI